MNSKKRKLKKRMWIIKKIIIQSEGAYAPFFVDQS